MHSILVNSNLTGQKLAPWIIKSVVDLYVKNYNKYLIIPRTLYTGSEMIRTLIIKRALLF